MMHLAVLLSSMIDTKAEMASIGMEAFQEFMVKPERLEKILERLEKARQKLY